MKKSWKILCAIGWSLSHMAEAEMEHMLRQNLCPHCGGSLRTSPVDTGPR